MEEEVGSLGEEEINIFFNNTVTLGNRHTFEWGRRWEQLSGETYKDIFIQVKINTVKPLKSNFGKTS